MKRRHLETTTCSKRTLKKELCIHRRLLEWGRLLIKNTFEGGRLFVKGRYVKSNHCGVSLELQSLNSTFNRGRENRFSSAPLWSVIFFSQSFALQVFKYCYEPFNKQLCDFITFFILCLSISRLALQLWIYQ